MGTLGTYSDRLVGRKLATENMNLLGHGLGESGLITAVFENKYEVSEAGADFRDHFIWAHDLIGEILIDFGLFGTAFLLLMYFKVIVDFTNNYLFGLVIALSFFLVSCLIGSSLFWGRTAYFIFLILGFGYSQKRLSNEG